MSSEIKNKVKINILGAEYSIIVEDSPEKVEAVVKYVDELTADIKKNSKGITNIGALVLSCLNMSEELYNLKENLSEIKQQDEELKFLANYKEKLTAAMDEVSDNAKKNEILQAKIEKLDEENVELNNLISEYKEKFHILRSEYERNKKNLEELQDLAVKNQIELAKAKNNLLDFN